MMRPPLGLPLPMPRSGPIDAIYRFPPQGPVILPGGPGSMPRPPMQVALGQRGPMPGGPMVLGRMPGPPPGSVHPQQPVIPMQQSQRPGLPPSTSGATLVNHTIRPGTSGDFNTIRKYFS